MNSADIKELMDRYNEYRAKWIQHHGDAEGFDEWYTQQATGAAQRLEQWRTGSPRMIRYTVDLPTLARELGRNKSHLWRICKRLQLGTVEGKVTRLSPEEVETLLTHLEEHKRKGKAMNYSPADLVLCVSADGWSLHAPGSTDDDIATGDAPYLLSGPGEGPTESERQEAFRIYTK